MLLLLILWQAAGPSSSWVRLMLAGGASVSRSIAYLPASSNSILIRFVLMSTRRLLAVLMRCFPVQEDLLFAESARGTVIPAGLQRRTAYPSG